MAIQFELYKTPHPKDEENKETYHARVVNFQHIDTDYLAKEIQMATSLTEGDVKSVLESLTTSWAIVSAKEKAFIWMVSVISRLS